MAAIAYPNPSLAGSTDAPDPWARPCPAGRPARPDLRVVAGGCPRRANHPAAAVYRRRRLAALVLVAALVAALVVAVRVVGGLGDGPHPVPEASLPVATPGEPQRYVVQPGDTVWDIARRLKPSGDVRSTVDRIIARNGSATLRPGQSLLLD